MKKLFSMLAVVCMGFFALALTSCGGDDDPSTDTDWEGLNIDGLKCFDTGNHLDEGGLYMHGLWSGPTSESKNVYAILYQMEFKVASVQKGKLDVTNFKIVGYDWKDIHDRMEGCKIVSGSIDCIECSKHEVKVRFNKLVVNIIDENGSVLRKCKIDGTASYVN